MHNLFYEHQKSFVGQNFFIPANTYDGDTPFYLNTNAAVNEVNRFTYNVKNYQPANSYGVTNLSWTASSDSYNEAGAHLVTAGFGNFLQETLSSSYTQSFSTSQITASFSSSSSSPSIIPNTTFNVSITAKIEDISTQTTDKKISLARYTEYDNEYFVSSSSSNHLVFGFTSRTQSLYYLDYETYQALSTYLSVGLTTSDNVSLFPVSYQNKYFNLAFFIAKSPATVSNIRWQDFNIVCSIVTDSTITSPVLETNLPPDKIQFAVTNTDASIYNINLPGLPSEQLILLTFNGFNYITTLSITTNPGNITTSFFYKTASTASTTNFITAVNYTSVYLSGNNVSTVALRIPYDSFSTFESKRELTPPGEFKQQTNISASRTETIFQDGYGMITYQRTVSQQYVYIHSHNGAFALQYAPITGYAPFINSFTSTSPIYQSISTSLVSSVSGSTFGGYFPYGAEIIPNVTQFVTNRFGSHEILVRVTENSTILTSSTQNSYTSTQTFSFNVSASQFETLFSNKVISVKVFTTQTSFSTLYTDSIYFDTKNFSSTFGRFTASRIDARNSTRVQIFSVILQSGINGLGKIKLGGGGDVGPITTADSVFVGGVYHFMDVLGINKIPTLYINDGNWFGTIYNAVNNVSVGIFNHRILIGEQNFIQTSMSVSNARAFFLTHVEQYRYQMINELFPDYAMHVNSALTENKTRRLAYSTSSPLYPDRHINRLDRTTANPVIPT